MKNRPPEPAQPAGPARSRQLLLLLVAVASLLLLFRLPVHNKWFHSQLMGYWHDIPEQWADEGGIEERKLARYGPGYDICRFIATTFEQKHITNAVILVEPNDYIQKLADFKMPEPAIFYYFTGGIPCVWTNSNNVATANFLLRIHKGNATSMVRISTPEQLRRIQEKYKMFKNNL